MVEIFGVSADPTRSCQVTGLGFWNDEEGSATIETVIWIPIFMFILALIINVSIVFFTESQILRVVQDGNRAFSLGRFEKVEEVEEYVLERLSYLDASLDIETVIASGQITTKLTAPATELMPFRFMSGVFDNVRVGVSAQHIVEY